MQFDEWWASQDWENLSGTEIEELARAAWNEAVKRACETLDLQGKHQSANLIRDELGYE